jgi:large subunit ribosomal protein L17
MRHRVKGRKLGRTASHRSATMAALATSLLKHKRIKTTLAKAKETRGFVEKLITKAKKNDLHAQKLVMQVIKDKETVKELFSEITISGIDDVFSPAVIFESTSILLSLSSKKNKITSGK